jgi:protoheme IX farnesyltransferase
MASAGFLLAAANTEWFDAATFAGLIAGTALVISSACVLNNYIDRGIDSKMKRTRERAIVTHEVSATQALVYTGILALLGFGCLALLTNWLTVLLGVAAYFAYIVLYGIAKRKTIYGTLVGAIAGGLPPVAGYAAVTNGLDIGALLLFLLLVAWQMPHFYAIAMRRRSDYAAAKLPVWPVVKGMQATRRQILGFIVLFVGASIAFTAWGYTGYFFAVVMVGMGIVWLLKGLRTGNDSAWARRMFFFSLLVLLTTCVMLAVGGLLP